MIDIIKCIFKNIFHKIKSRVLTTLQENLNNYHESEKIFKMFYKTDPILLFSKQFRAFFL